MGTAVLPTKLRKAWLRSAVMISVLAVAAAPVWGQTIVNGGHAYGGAVHGAPFGAPPVPTAGPPVPGPSSGYFYHYHYSPYFNGYNSGRGYGTGGFAYAVPYYYPVDNSAYGYDYVGGGGPDLYSGPPIGPDPGMHMIVEQPPAQPYGSMPYGSMPSGPPDGPYAPPMASAQPPVPPPADVQPSDPTVLVFRNGHQQEVTNYAIMGDSLYVFDQGRKKIALADLDIPATVKANDDRGVQFNIPPAPKKKSTTVPQSTSPDDGTKPPASVAAVMP